MSSLSHNPALKGSRTFGQFFHGLIDTVRIYGRAPSPAEIISNKNSPVEFIMINRARLWTLYH